jgi:hypothetical protein
MHAFRAFRAHVLTYAWPHQAASCTEHSKKMFALRNAAKKQAQSLLRQEPQASAGQKRLMSGGEDDGIKRVNWCVLQLCSGNCSGLGPSIHAPCLQVGRPDQPRHLAEAPRE